MKKTLLILTAMCLAVSGCSTVKSFRKKHDHSHDYRQTAHYQSTRVSIPKDLTDQNIKDYFAVPDISNPNDPRIPKLTPPSAEPTGSKA